jgi:hypothetical protein
MLGWYIEIRPWPTPSNLSPSGHQFRICGYVILERMVSHGFSDSVTCSTVSSDAGVINQMVIDRFPI